MMGQVTSTIFVISAAMALSLSIYCQSAIGQYSIKTVELTVDRTALYLPCINSLPAKYRSCPDELSVKVTARKDSRKGDSLRFVYVVSSGTIVGEGSDIIWDLSGADPGSYYISATVYKGTKYIGKSSDIRVTVSDCIECSAECLRCPDLTIRSSKPRVKVGDVIDLEVPKIIDAEYVWTADGAEIIQGQGTDRIRARVIETGKDSITVRFEIRSGGLCFEAKACPNMSDISLPIVR